MTTDNNPRTINEVLQTYLDGNVITPKAYKLSRDINVVIREIAQTYKHISGVNTLDAETTNHINAVAQWLTNSHKWGVMLMGSVGNGKTTMAKSLFHLFTFYRDNNIMSISSRKFATTKEIVKWVTADTSHYDGCKNTDVLFIDDLGEEPSETSVYGKVITPVSDVLMHRYDHGKITIITTNIDPDDLASKYKDRVYDRLKQMCDVVPFLNDSYRK